MSQSIFGGQTVESYLAARWAQLERDIAARNTIGDAEQVTEAVVDRYLIEPARLRRDAADFQPNETVRGIELDVEIPIEGHATLVGLSPSKLGMRPAISGVWVEKTRWAEAEQTSRVILKKTFKVAPSPAEVKAWTRDQVDLIEKYLAAYAVEVEAFNTSVRGDVPTLVKQRQEILAGAKTLRDELGPGI